jgi:hypothetical protein
MSRESASSQIMSRQDLRFLLVDWLHTEELFERERFAEHSLETVDAVLELAESVATAAFAPHNRASDLEEPRWDGEQVHLVPEVKKAVDAYAAADLLRLGFDADHGGLQLPTVVSVASGAWFAAANYVVTAGPEYPRLATDLARRLLTVSDGMLAHGENVKAVQALLAEAGMECDSLQQSRVFALLVGWATKRTTGGVTVSVGPSTGNGGGR